MPSTDADPDQHQRRARRAGAPGNAARRATLCWRGWPPTCSVWARRPAWGGFSSSTAWVRRHGRGLRGLRSRARPPRRAQAACTSGRRRAERALAEAQALARLSHPNVVAVHDVGVAGDHVFLVMEFMRGADAARGWRRAAPTRARWSRRIRQAAAGLAAAHAAGLVHRDFKPDNALFGDDGRVRVVDFGLPATPTPRRASTSTGPRHAALHGAGAAPAPRSPPPSISTASASRWGRRSRPGQPARASCRDGWRRPRPRLARRTPASASVDGRAAARARRAIRCGAAAALAAVARGGRCRRRFVAGRPPPASGRRRLPRRRRRAPGGSLGRPPPALRRWPGWLRCARTAPRWRPGSTGPRGSRAPLGGRPARRVPARGAQSGSLRRSSHGLPRPRSRRPGRGRRPGRTTDAKSLPTWCRHPRRCPIRMAAAISGSLLANAGASPDRDRRRA